MHLKRLAPGARAPEGWDYIRVEQTPSGRFDLSGAIAHEGGAVFSQAIYPSREEAETAGKAWASEQGAEIVYLETLGAAETTK